MRDRLLNIWQLLRVSLWTLPALITALLTAVAFALLVLDRQLALSAIPAWVFPGGKAGAREILSTIASSTITVAGVAFSITIVALSLAASQYGSLLLSSYLRDPLSQSALGVFVGTFFYCLVVLSSVSEAQGASFLPKIAVSFSLILALASVIAFVAFINHLALSMQSEHLASRIGESLLRAVDELFPEELESNTEEERVEMPQRDDSDAWQVKAAETGYLQAIEFDSLLAFATTRNLTVRLTVKPGDFVSAGSPVASVWGGEGEHEAVERVVTKRLLIGRQRTPTQDPEYAVHQLAQTAVRALSPGINDPYTALICIDWLEAALRLLTTRGLPSGAHRDKQGHVRLIAPRQGFEPMANAAFNKIRHAGCTQSSIMMRLAKAVGSVASQAHRGADRKVLHRHLDAILEDARAGLTTERERREMEALYREIESAELGATK